MRAPFSYMHLVSLLAYALFISVLLSPAAALAHRVNIFAWAEGTVVHTEATFSSGNKAQKSHVVASEKDTGTVISEGDTNDNGIWSFTLTKDILERKPDILLSLSAGEGHANTWTISATDYADAAHVAGSGPSAITDANNAESADSSNDMAPFMEETSQSALQSTASAGNASGMSKEELQQLVENAVSAALEKKLAPIRRQLAEEAQHAPTLQDILGGIGYIFGLMGVAAYVTARKRT